MKSLQTQIYTSHNIFQKVNGYNENPKKINLTYKHGNFTNVSAITFYVGQIVPFITLHEESQMHYKDIKPIIKKDLDNLSGKEGIISEILYNKKKYISEREKHYTNLNKNFRTPQRNWFESILDFFSGLFDFTSDEITIVVQLKDNEEKKYKFVHPSYKQNVYDFNKKPTNNSKVNILNVNKNIYPFDLILNILNVEKINSQRYDRNVANANPMAKKLGASQNNSKKGNLTASQNNSKKKGNLSASQNNAKKSNNKRNLAASQNNSKNLPNGKINNKL